MTNLCERFISRAKARTSRATRWTLPPHSARWPAGRISGCLRRIARPGLRRQPGAGRYRGAQRPGGTFVDPTLFVGANNSMAIAREEVFGPVATVQAFDTEAEATGPGQ